MESINRALSGNEPLWKVFWFATFTPLFVAFLLGGVLAKLDAGDAALIARHIFWLKLAVFPYSVFCSYLVYRNLHNIEESTLYARMAMMFCIFCSLWLLRGISLGPNLPPPPPPKLALINPYHPKMQAAPALSKEEGDARSTCIRNMNDYALQNHVDPKKYVYDNQSYLQKCTEYLMNKKTQPQAR